MGYQRKSLPEDDEDTLELELTPEEMDRLSAAAKAQIPRFRRRLRLWPIALVAAVASIAAAMMWRPTSPPRAAQRVGSTPTLKITPPATVQPPAADSRAAAAAAAAQPAVPTASSSHGIRVKNPFDAQEVFEFPAGTSRAEARRKVSALLLERAIDRGNPAAGPSAAGKSGDRDN